MKKLKKQIKKKSAPKKKFPRKIHIFSAFGILVMLPIVLGFALYARSQQQTASANCTISSSWARTVCDGSNKNCYTGTGLGFDTAGSRYPSCPVTYGSSNAKTCIVPFYSNPQTHRVYYIAGYGSSGVYPVSTTSHGITITKCITPSWDLATKLKHAVALPQSVVFTIQVLDYHNQPVSGIQITMQDNGKTPVTLTSRYKGEITYISYPGDTIIMWSTNSGVSPAPYSAVVNATRIIPGKNNVVCGTTSLGQKPCTFYYRSRT